MDLTVYAAPMATVVITGANRGIGLQLAKLFKDRGDHVIAACRSSSPGLDELAHAYHPAPHHGICDANAVPMNGGGLGQVVDEAACQAFALLDP